VSNFMKKNNPSTKTKSIVPARRKPVNGLLVNEMRAIAMEVAREMRGERGEPAPSEIFGAARDLQTAMRKVDSAPAPCGPNVPRLEELMCVLEASTCELHERLSMLGHVLQPVLLPENPNGTATGGQPAEPMAPMAANLVQQIGTVRGAIVRVMEFIERLQLQK